MATSDKSGSWERWLHSSIWLDPNTADGSVGKSMSIHRNVDERSRSGQHYLRP